MTLRPLRDFSLALCAVVIMGCGGAGSEGVEGKVTLDGDPLPMARLMLLPKDAKVEGPFMGNTDNEGRFTIGPIGDPNGGVPAGAYRLTISTAFTTGDDETAVAPSERAPAPYPAGVDFEVPDGGVTDAEFDLTSK